MEAHLRSVPAESGEEAALAGHAPRFEEFYESTFRRVFTALCLVTGDRYEAEEVAQEAFLRVFERWDRVGALDDPTG
jgi:DNA-directed RNA polymerase specialized sigma24 family protein